VVVGSRELQRAVAANPFPQANADHKSVHLFFLAEAPQKSVMQKLQELAGGNGDAFALKGKVLYLHTPNGFPRSKLAARAEWALRVDATARNGRRCVRLIELAKQIGGSA